MIDFKITQFLNHFGAGTSIDTVSGFVSSTPVLIIFWFIITIIFCALDKNKGKWLFLSLIIALVLDLLITQLLFKNSGILPFKLRPYMAYSESINPLGSLLFDSSFPSGHVAITAALGTVIVYFYRKTWWIFLILVLIMAYSRIHNGMHYASDVLAGAVLGFAYGLAAVGITQGIRNYLDKKKSI